MIKPNSTKWEHLPKRKRWWERRKLKLRTMGISNISFDRENDTKYSVQFYDYDLPEGYKERLSVIKAEINTIMRIFPYDCLLYQTKHGIHFISFSLLRGTYTTKARAVEISKSLGNQDYWTTSHNLVLRIAPKWKYYKFSKIRFQVSKKPEFFRILKKPMGYIISNKHLEFYLTYMNLPKKIYHLYDDCDKRDYDIGIYHYKTRD